LTPRYSISVTWLQPPLKDLADIIIYITQPVDLFSNALVKGYAIGVIYGVLAIFFSLLVLLSFSIEKKVFRQFFVNHGLADGAKCKDLNFVYTLFTFLLMILIIVEMIIALQGLGIILLIVFWLLLLHKKEQSNH
jgi:hypothetical protein